MSVFRFMHDAVQSPLEDHKYEDFLGEFLDPQQYREEHPLGSRVGVYCQLADILRRNPPFLYNLSEVITFQVQ